MRSSEWSSAVCFSDLRLQPSLKGRVDPAVEGRIACAEPVRPAAVPRSRAPCGFLRVQRQDQRQVGPQPARGDTAQIEENSVGKHAFPTLIGKRGVQKTVADNPLDRKSLV